MNFFERQRQVKRMSGRLVALFVLAVIGIVAVVDVVVLLILGGIGRPPDDVAGLLVLVGVLVVGLIGLSSLVRTVQLRSGGGGHVARSLGAVPVPANPTDPQLRRLRNV